MGEIVSTAAVPERQGNLTTSTELPDLSRRRSPFQIVHGSDAGDDITAFTLFAQIAELATKPVCRVNLFETKHRLALLLRQ
jgi:hypothetical protein